MLKETLIKEYGGFADKRIKYLDKGHYFLVDDRCSGDIGADKEPLSPFCSISADVKGENEIKVSLSRNVPMGATVEQWITENNASYNGAPWPTTRLSIMIPAGQQAKLASLANAIRSIVARNAPRYSVKSYKYTCPRTAASLERLKNTLDKAWL
jgi:hypothetical protein